MLCLPHPDFDESAQCLDRLTLGGYRQSRVKSLLWVLRERGERTPLWMHPMFEMWRGYDDALENYGVALDREWSRRGYRGATKYHIRPGARMPWWIGDDRVHAGHRASLLAKLPDWYGQFGWTPAPKFWPIREGKKM